MAGGYTWPYALHVLNLFCHIQSMLLTTLQSRISAWRYSKAIQKNCNRYTDGIKTSQKNRDSVESKSCRKICPTESMSEEAARRYGVAGFIAGLLFAVLPVHVDYKVVRQSSPSNASLNVEKA